MTFSARPGLSALLEYCKIRPGFEMYNHGRSGRTVWLNFLLFFIYLFFTMSEASFTGRLLT